MRTLMLGLAATLALAASANATTYVGARTVGAATVDFTIVTDDTLGVLGEDNIVDWKVVVKNNGETATFGGPDSGDDSKVDIFGSAFTATTSGLYFDFSAPGVNYVAFVSDFRQSWCLQTNSCFDQNGPEEIAVAGAFVTNFDRAPRSGLQQLAGVPEPATWAMMLIGFAGVGGAMRSRRPVLAG
ncbi:MAG: PEP-CTERM sorting domain-containing protein [Phenylobacterium sp.]|uniref:PEPxxWA-CTERM sorting domain-containing protein n=1 Tax=Phenylobacterium sp. TaxID=1871053 RepID=UPI00122AF853|nr:PEPxxWA-CTERM sorting domain-containing protein [Phenylobacterium sp.]TAJ71086.1 MAG: PEP-CTERM sorting domain-containing protein [Phenylobacterium sp.]